MQLFARHAYAFVQDTRADWRYDPATSRVGHIQIAGVPERNEPDTGELNCPHLFALIDRLGYRGHIGCEYKPRGATSAGLGWIKPWLG